MVYKKQKKTILSHTNNIYIPMDITFTRFPTIKDIKDLRIAYICAKHGNKEPIQGGTRLFEQDFYIDKIEGDNTLRILSDIQHQTQNIFNGLKPLYQAFIRHYYWTGDFFSKYREQISDYFLLKYKAELYAEIGHECDKVSDKWALFDALDTMKLGDVFNRRPLFETYASQKRKKSGY